MADDWMELKRKLAETTERLKRADDPEERYDLGGDVRELKKQTPKDGDVWFFILSSWFSGWERICTEKPGGVDTKYRPLAATAGSWVYSQPKPYPLDVRWLDRGYEGSMLVSQVVWAQLLDW